MVFFGELYIYTELFTENHEVIVTQSCQI